MRSVGHYQSRIEGRRSPEQDLIKIAVTTVPFHEQ